MNPRRTSRFGRTALSAAIEPLEGRQLRSVTTLNGTSGSDHFKLNSLKAGDTIVYNGKGGHDSITIASSSEAVILGTVQLKNANGGDWAIEIDTSGGILPLNVKADAGKVTGAFGGTLDYSGTTVRGFTAHLQSMLPSTATINDAPAADYDEFHFDGTWAVSVGSAAYKLAALKHTLQVSDENSTTSTLKVSDSGDNAKQAITITGKRITGLSAQPINYNGFATLNVLAGSGDKTVNIQGTDAVTTFSTLGGKNAVTVGNNGSLDGLHRNLKLVDTFGDTKLTFDDSKDATDRTWAIDAHQVNRSGLGTLVNFYGHDEVNVLAGQGADDISINGTDGQDFALNAGAGDDSVYLYGTAGKVTLDGGTQNGKTFLYGDSLDIGYPGRTGASHVAAGLTSKNIEDVGLLDDAETKAHSYKLQPGSIWRDGVQIIAFTGETRAAVLGGSGNDVIDASTYDKTTTLEGLGGNDVIYGSRFNDLVQGGDGNDTLYSGDGGQDFLTGEKGDDLLIMAGNGAISSVDGGTGVDTLRTASLVKKLTTVESVFYTASVSGSVFADTNKNGKQDAGEKGMSGVQVWVDVNHSGTFDSGDLSTFTDSQGNYTVDDITLGQYQVHVLPPYGYKQTAPAAQPVYTVNLTQGMTATDLKFGVAVK